jgi:cytochrome c1
MKVTARIQGEGVNSGVFFRAMSGTEKAPSNGYEMQLHNGKKINLSLKGESSPSLAGGGLKGLELAVPGIAKKFMTAAYTELKDKRKLNAGDKVPDVFGKIGGSDKVKIVVGNAKMGGPIDYMYIGPMTVSGPYDAKKNVVKLNGTLTEAQTYARSHELYFRLRARREDQRFDPTAKNKDGSPKIYGVSPSKGDSAGRIVVTDSVPSSAVIVNI